MTTIGGFSLEDAQQIHRLVLGKSAVQKPSTGKSTVFNRAYYARLTADLPAATDPLTGYTQAEATVLRYLGTSVDSLDMEETTETIIVTNRSTSYSASENDVIQVDRLGSEWAPKHASGGSNSPGDECPCECTDEPDLILHDIYTLNQWKVQLPELRWKQQFGAIVLQAGSYTVVWDEARQLWILDIGDMLTAEYNGGADATQVTTMDGEITLSWPNPTGASCCVMSELKVCVTGTVPQEESSVGVGVGFNYGYTNGFEDGYSNNPYDDRVIFAGPTGTGAGTGQYQQFGTGTYLAPGTGTYGENTGTGTGTGTFMWSDYEEGFYRGYKDGYAIGYANGQSTLGTGTAPGTGTSPGAGTGVGGP